MPLSVGDKLGHYEILSLLGKGGMGEVYKARDTKLDRQVAIKVLPSALARDPERLARFEREAKVLASLNHSNIAQIYAIEEVGGIRALVMELVPGQTLKSPLPLDEALRIAGQVAEGLEVAHDKGVIHRDLKPANIMITPTGAVKVLDFGLAAVTQPAASNPGGDPSQSPTVTMGLSQAGMIMGTAGYMAPEQAAGQAVDKRADIWSFGVVLWEMLAGQRLFTGDTAAHIMADVLRAPIDFDKLPAATPPAIRTLLKRCLDRDVKTRLRDIGEARIAIQNVGKEPEVVATASAPAPRHGSWLPWCIAAFLLLALMPANILHFRETPPPEQTLRSAITLPENSTVHSLAISPDGRTLVIAAAVNGKRQLWLRPLDALQAQPMPFTEDAEYPFWSPDSRYVGFFAEGKLKKVAASGGPSESLCDAPAGRGGSWSRDDVIVFSPNTLGVSIQRVAAAGGVPADVTKTKGDQRYPVFLPDGRHFLYEVLRGTAEGNGIYFSSLDGKENRRLLPDASGLVFAPSAHGDRIGHILFVRENTLMAAPFDAPSAQVAGDVFPVAEGVSVTGNTSYLPAAVSGSGVLLYQAGGANNGGTNQIGWYDRSGKFLGPVGAPGGAVGDPAISPDEKSVALRRVAGNRFDLWVRDLSRGTETRFTSEGSINGAPFWSPLGDRIIFSSNRNGRVSHLYQKATNGSGHDEALLSDNGSSIPTQWSRDGRFIVYQELNPKNRYALWVLSTEGAAAGRKPLPFLQSEFNEMFGQLSPDSHWMAFTSERSGRREVYVRPFPPADGEWTISIAGGEQSRWRGDGKELFFVAADGKMMAVSVKAAAGVKATFEAAAPVPLFESHVSQVIDFVYQYDVTADGKRFLINTTGATGSVSPPLTVVTNWTAGLKK